MLCGKQGPLKIHVLNMQVIQIRSLYDTKLNRVNSITTTHSFQFPSMFADWENIT